MIRQIRTSPSRRRGVALAAGLAAAIVLPGTAVPGAAASPTGAGPAPERAATASRCSARAARDRLSLSQRVGQLFMIGTPATGASASVLDQIRRLNVGNVMLTGRSRAGVAATARVSATLRARATDAATGGVGLWIATDQEGGAVQVLKGAGFSTLPSALTQGSWSTATLRARSESWGRQLRAAGVTMNLAPVADVVPSWKTLNPPILAHRRMYGRTAAAVGPKSLAFAAGMRAAGVQPVVKHFPGLGLVTANTDTRARVHDRHTTKASSYVDAFEANLRGGTGVVMMSSAYYDRIDPKAMAVFSRPIITTWLRGELGFGGVVMTDDVGAARSPSVYSPATRAVRFLDAGGDLVLTVTPSVVPAMRKAVYDRARRDPAFRARVDAAVLRILAAKERQGLLAGACG